ncbi:MAG: site-2 protease family protein, partial [Elusimicrobia bacterium]|nr:site-2 protease family protein [Elusimicrobiota bacterium]
MRSRLVVARVLGVEVALHPSWLVLAALLLSSLGGHFSATAPEWGSRLIWTTAGVATLLVFVSLLLHELAHAAVARVRGLPVSSITLFALGGAAQLKAEAPDPRAEFWMSLAGPAASAGLAAAAFLGLRALGPQPLPHPAGELLAWVGAINAALAVFNLIPGFPLDGGRLLRAALWAWLHDFWRATRIATRAGQGVACAFLLLGMARAFAGAPLAGLWTAVLGWFLLEASTSAYVQAEIRRSLSGLTARQLMDRDFDTVEGRVPLAAFADGPLRDGGSPFVVCDHGRPAGLITAREAAQVPRPSWTDTTVAEAMRPLRQVPSVSPDTPAAEAL